MADNVFILNIAQILTQARDEIRANMASKGINASGRTSAALQVVQRGDKVMLIKAEGQNAPFGTLQYGRAGGGVPAGFYYILQQWTRDKGLSFSSERERNTFAYFLSRKIAREGTQRHRQPREDVYTQPIQDAVQDVRKAAREYVMDALKASVSSRFL